jgi:hypothetical protein
MVGTTIPTMRERIGYGDVANAENQPQQREHRIANNRTKVTTTRALRRSPCRNSDEGPKADLGHETATHRGAHNHGITTVAEPRVMTCHAMSGGATYPYRTAPPGH